MFEYIYRDMLSMVRFLPYGLVLGVVVFVILFRTMNGIRKRSGRGPAAMLPVAAFGTYLSLMLVITFLSRESGSGGDGIDLELFSTWGINDRNNAFVVENVLLFIPYGILGPWAMERLKRLWSCVLLGAVTSLTIEILQLVTERGYFQIDDILTNILGTAIGYFVWRLFFHGRK
nr:VanZ family protein [uncultured Acetatifactor sp.]